MVHRYRMTLWGVALVIAGLLAGCAADKAGVVDAYRQAYNAHDVDGVMNLMAEDAIFRVSGVFDLRGKEAIRDVAEFDAVLHLTMTMREVSISGDTVSCVLIETNDWLQFTGLDSAVYLAQFVVVDGAITAILAESSPNTAEAMAGAMGPMIQWAGESQPDELSRLIVDGRMVFDADNARRMMRLFRAWGVVTDRGKI